MTQAHFSGPILLAHDEPKARAALARGLAGAGYSVVEASVLDEGFDLLYAERPAVAIVHAGLPDGAALKLGMAARARGAKVLVLDAAGEPSGAAMTMQVFADATRVQAPLTSKAVTLAVGRAIGTPVGAPQAA